MACSSEHHGIVHGKIIKLDKNTGLPDGQEVKVIVEPREPASAVSASEEDLRRSFGAWADDADGLDDYLRWNRDQRGTSRTEIAS